MSRPYNAHLPNPAIGLDKELEFNLPCNTRLTKFEGVKRRLAVQQDKLLICWNW